MGRFASPAVRWGLAGGAMLLCGIALVVFVALEHNRAERQREALTHMLATNSWITSQLYLELHRFLSTTDRFVLADGEVPHDEVMLRFNILWSRIPPFLNGPESAAARAVDGAVATVRALRSDLAELEPIVAELTPGDTAGRAAIRSELVGYLEPLHDVFRTVGAGNPADRLAADIRDLEDRRTLFMGAITGAALLLVLGSCALGVRSYRLAQAERQARDAAEAADRTKARFLANMSHELRTPLNAIMGFAQLIQQESFGPVGHSYYRDYAGDIHTSAQHLLMVLNDVLDLARIEAGKLSIDETTFDPVSGVSICLRMLAPDAEAKGVTLQPDLPETGPRLVGDARLFRQVCLNLVGNAIKFTPSGGHVSVAWRHGEAGWTLRVSDDGPGIAEGDQNRVTEPFYQSGMGGGGSGSGLGLALARRYIELHDGTLEIASVPGQGTVVLAHLPAVREAAPNAAQDAAIGA